MAKVTVTVCDVCADVNRPTRRYVITSEGKRVTTDLCDEHDTILAAMLAGAETGQKDFVAERTTTMEEIEKLKLSNRKK